MWLWAFFLVSVVISSGIPRVQHQPPSEASRKGPPACRWLADSEKHKNRWQAGDKNTETLRYGA